MRLIVRGEPELRARLTAMPQAVTRAMRVAMSKALNLVYRRVALNLTGHVLNVKTGHLRQSIQTAMGTDGLSGRIGTNVNYAAIHEYGGRTAAHRIEARAGKMLRFAKTGGGGALLTRTKAGGIRKSKYNAGLLAFVRAVEHPGSVVPARPYMRPALADSRAEISGLLRSGLIAAIKAAP